MTAFARTLIAGLGSPHGDDAVGWRVAEMMVSAAPAEVRARCAAVPLDLLVWLEGVDRLVICDASDSKEPEGTLQYGHWPGIAIEGRRGAGSHDVDLVQTLQLAESLGKLPKDVRVYAIAGRNFEPGARLSPELEAALPGVVHRILEDLRDARTIAGHGAA